MAVDGRLGYLGEPRIVCKTKVSVRAKVLQIAIGDVDVDTLVRF